MRFGDNTSMTTPRRAPSRCVRRTTVPSSYLKVNQSRLTFGLEWGAFYPDGLLQNVTILIVGHCLAAMLLLEPLALLPHPAIWLSLTLALTWLLLPRRQGPAVDICRAHKTRG